MYQFYYGSKKHKTIEYKKDVRELIDIIQIRPTMWEEHCLECAAPACFNNCSHYLARCDGRCKRFENGINTFEEMVACNHQGMNVQFRKWANMMTIIFPSYLSIEEYANLHIKNEKLGAKLAKLANSPLPIPLKWNSIRTVEFIRRRNLRKMESHHSELNDYFVFHGYSRYDEDFKLIVEVFDDHLPKAKISIDIKKGENLSVVSNLSKEFFEPNYLVKVYPENDLEVELDILWCDFVKGNLKSKYDSKIKCVVWDLDNTLWNGILIETEDTDSLTLKDGVLQLIKDLDSRGIVQSVASKNDYDQAWPVLEKLDISDYFLYPQINWGAKSSSLKTIAKCLNIGIDSFALIDDSEFERNEVLMNAPEVRVYTEKQINELLSLGEFDVVVTEDSKHRREMYRAEEQRAILQQDNQDDAVEFIKKCNLTIEIFEPKTDEELLRCFELITRTNQLNLSGRKYTKEEFNQMLSLLERKTYAIRSYDNFGNYGIVGFLQYEVKENQLVFKEYAMSCRVAGKYIESALFSHLLLEEKCEKGNFSIEKTKKNQLLRRTIEGIGFEIKNEAKTTIDYLFDQDLLNVDLVKIVR